jgi:hypothetical protein
MTFPSPAEQSAIPAAEWSAEEVAAMACALVAFRNGLPSHQRAAFDSILVPAGDAADGDVQGYITGKGSGAASARGGIVFGSWGEPDVVGAIVTSFGNLVRGIG